MNWCVPNMVAPTALDDDEFDLRGYFVIPSARADDELQALNRAYDGFPALGHGEWVGNAQRHPVHSGGHDASVRTQYNRVTDRR